jgi:hypothetical protein
MYSSTCFGRPHAHHQELNCSSSLWFYRWRVVVAVLLVVVRPAGPTTTNCTAAKSIKLLTKQPIFQDAILQEYDTVSLGKWLQTFRSRLCLKCDGSRSETRFRISAKRTSPFKSAGPSVQSTTGSRGVRISGRNVGYTMFRGSVKDTGYPLHSPASPSLPHPASPCAIIFQLDSTVVRSSWEWSSPP